MLPVLIQNLIKRNKSKSKGVPTSKQEAEYYNDKFGSFVLWFVVVLVLVGLFLK